MTRSRAITLVLGVVALFVFSFWRLFPGENGAATPVAPSSRKDPSARGGLFDFGGQVMGTTYSVRCELPSGVSTQQAQEVVHRSLDEVDKMMSTYKIDSELSQLNAAPAGEVRRVSPPLLEVLQLSEQVHKQSGGAFDVTVGPLVAAWGFGSAAQSDPPTEAELEKARAAVGFSLIQIDPGGSTVQKTVPELKIDLSAVAKGYGVDRAALALAALGVQNYLVEVGGELRFLGDKPATSGKRAPWLLAIEEPVAEGRRLHATFSAPREGGALATSGDYRNFREEEGSLVSHILDPRSGAPVPRRTASVSVYRPRAAEADALATALFVLSPTESLALAEQEGWAIYLLVHQPGGGFKSIQSPAFGRLGPTEVTLPGR